MAALCVMLLAACWSDYRKRKIPNVLIAVIVFWGAVLHFCQEGAMGSVIYLSRTVMAAGSLYCLFKIGTVGAGDVKLFGVTAGYLPFQKILIFLFVSLLFAAIFSLVKMIRHNNFSERLKVFLSYSVKVWKSGRWELYPADGTGRNDGEICLSGPILLSLLLYLGGVY